MQHTRPHNRQEFELRQRERTFVDDVRPRSQQAYQPRAKTMLPSNDDEYMISLGARASRRQEPHPTQITTFEKIRTAMSGFRPKLATKAPLLSLLAMLVFVGFGFAITKGVDPATANKSMEQIMFDNGDTPHDKSPYNQLGYAVSPTMPKLLTIPKLGVTSRITRVSVRENSEPKFPTNIYDTGWYENSVKPGEDGAALLIGHVRGEVKPGVFHDLTNLVPGDEFSVELGDGTMKHYYIVKMIAYPRNGVDYQELLTAVTPDKPGLNLLTAIGAFESNAEVVQQLGVFAIEKTSSNN
jgi:hypothetical protein